MLRERKYGCERGGKEKLMPCYATKDTKMRTKSQLKKRKIYQNTMAKKIKEKGAGRGEGKQL